MKREEKANVIVLAAVVMGILLISFASAGILDWCDILCRLKPTAS